MSSGFGEDGINYSYKGARIVVPGRKPDMFTLGLNDEETKAVGPDPQLNLHLTFSNPDHGNAFVVVPTVMTKEQARAGASELIGNLDPGAIKFFRQYQCLDVFDEDSDARFRTVSLAFSSAALKSLSNCVTRMLTPH